MPQIVIDKRRRNAKFCQPKPEPNILQASLHKQSHYITTVKSLNAARSQNRRFDDRRIVQPTCVTALIAHMYRTAICRVRSQCWNQQDRPKMCTPHLVIDCLSSGLTSQLTQNRPCWIHSSQPISWFSTEKRNVWQLKQKNASVTKYTAKFLTFIP